MKSLKMKCGKALANTALMVTAKSVNSACMLLVHQPKLPDGAKKLRKF
ncbi:MAG TPA: cyclic lactone autoinducer peptide [Epulopiscium sp.]|nr:cyclic lactone autoinducer peptide [Candidatus Epulonipiscium sp.]